MNRWLRIAIFPLLGLAGYGILAYLQAQFGLGDYAESPQRFTLPRNERKLVAGGRAGIEYQSARYGKAKLLVRCLEGSQAVQREVEVEKGGEPVAVCKVKIVLVELHGSDGVRADFEVSWER
jgi:hypothetical protein